MRRSRGAAALVFLVAASRATAAAERSYPVDCLPDRVVSWEAAGPSPGARYGAASVPGIVLGPPGNSVPYQGATTVASLGFAGRAVLAFDDVVLEDRPGPDFIVFENAFFQLPLPVSAADPFTVFAEPGFVEVSEDGITWHMFGHDAQALQQVPDQAGGTIGKDLFERLRGLAGVTPTFTGNWTVPDDPAVFDPGGSGGVSGAGGDAFDLADVGLTEARYIRITDADTQAGFPGSTEGFDLDAVIALHARPRPPSSPDGDGDRLSDAEEILLYGSNPALADSDGDGVDDGREVAACRSPLGASVLPSPAQEPRIFLQGRSCTAAIWSFLGSGVTYDLVRGDLDRLSALAHSIDLGPTICLVRAGTSVRWSCDGELPPGGHAFFYLARVHGATDWGRGSSLTLRGSSAECP